MTFRPSPPRRTRAASGEFRGGIDSVVAPRSAFVDVTTTHMAVLRACLPRMTADGAYSIVVGDSARRPIPSSGLVSLQQSAVLMMHRVLEAELDATRRVFALMLGAVATRDSGGKPISAEQVGAVAVAVSARTAGGRIIALHDEADGREALTSLGAS